MQDQDGTAADRRTPAPRLELPSPRPLDALWSYRRRPPSDLNAVMAARAAMIWRAPNRPSVARVAKRYLAGWLFRFPSEIIQHAKAHGKRAKREMGRGYCGQVADMVRVGCSNGVMPWGYYLAGMPRHGGGPKLFHYVPPSLFSAVIERITFDRDPATFGLSRDKLAFERRCRQLGFPVVQTVAFAQGKRADQLGEPPLGPLPAHDLIIKPRRGNQGRSIERWRCADPDCFERDGERLSAAALLARISSQALSRGRDLLVQECATNHLDLHPIAGSALATLRIVTAANEDGVPEIVEAFYKTSTAPEACVDNFHAGGTAFPIDFTTGLFREGFVYEPWSRRSFTHHPVTGTAMVGHVHPAWDEMSRFALRLHGALPNFVFVGWDIGLTPNGPLVLEANVAPGLPLVRQARADGLDGTRYFELVAFHAREWLRRNEPTTSRWRATTL